MKNLSFLLISAAFIISGCAEQISLETISPNLPGNYIGKNLWLNDNKLVVETEKGNISIDIKEFSNIYLQATPENGKSVIKKMEISFLKENHNKLNEQDKITIDFKEKTYLPNISEE